MAREPIPTWYFALVVVHRAGRFLLVQERRPPHDWYLPAGRVEPGETLLQAAHRETREEAGIPIAVEGLLRMEHTPRGDGTARCRAIFVASPADDTPLKSEPDDESLGAAWVSLEDLSHYPLRGDEVRECLEYVANGGPVYPLHVLVPEGAPLKGGT